MQAKENADELLAQRKTVEDQIVEAAKGVADAEQAAWVVDPRGQRWRGAAAINAALAAALGWPWLLRLYAVPWIGARQDRVYAWVARHRRRLPGITPAWPPRQR